jgi:hypothetical protein
MNFNSNSVPEDTTFTGDTDPLLKRQAGAAITQDILLGTYWANTMGRNKKPGVYHMYKEELRNNLGGLMNSKMTYRQIEEYLNVVGYDSNDIRCMFKELTGLDPVKLEFMRLEDLKATPGNIPGFNCGWGLGKGKGVEAYFIMPNHYGLYTVYAQKNDMEREEVKSFLRHEEAVDHLSKLVKKVHRYDMSVQEMVEDAPELDMDEPTSKFYTSLADRFYDLEKKGALADEYVIKTVRDTVTCGNLTEAEGEILIKKYAADVPGPTPAESVPVSPAHVEETGPSTDEARKTIKNIQENTSVEKEMRKRTPQDFFKASLPGRLEEIATEHIEDVLSYIANRESDIDSFGISLHSLQYQKHDAGKAIGEINPQTGEPSGPPQATISAILEIENKTMSSDKNRKFALAVFFVSPSGQISTSDSIKGEDEIIYGFTQEGLESYFRKSKGE